MSESRSAYAPPPVVPAGSRVVLVVSRGPHEVAPVAYIDVPDVTGLAQGAALSALQRAGLTARVFNDYSRLYARGKVMGQIPSGGSNAASGSEVVLLVSTGAAVTHTAEVVLPDVVGESESQAVTEIQAAGLSPQVTREYSRTVPAGVVMAQLPNSVWVTSLARRGRPTWWLWLLAALLLLALVVLAFLLLGRGTTVPNVVGMTQAEAVNTLRDADLQLGSVSQTQTASVAEGNVAAQAPQPGERVPRGTEVALAVEAGASLVTVPNLRGATQEQAEERLAELGLRSAIRLERNDRVTAGTVTEQQPAAGNAVVAGTTVTLTIAQSAAAEEVEVPSVAGLTRVDAEATIVGLGLRVLVVENPSATVAEGVAIGQLPAAGGTVLPGATVAIVISTGAPEDATTVAAPDVVGEELPDAQEDVARAGLRSQPLAVDGTDENANDVLAQWPAAGEALPPDSTMVLLYAR